MTCPIPCWRSAASLESDLLSYLLQNQSDDWWLNLCSAAQAWAGVAMGWLRYRVSNLLSISICQGGSQLYLRLRYYRAARKNYSLSYRGEETLLVEVVYWYLVGSINGGCALVFSGSHQ